MDVPEGFAPFEPQGPFLKHVGPIQVRDGEGGPVFGLRAEERHTNHRGTIQGGLLSTFADFALGRAIEAGAEDGKDRATVSLTVDFLRPATPGDWIESRARVERVGGTASFADRSLTVEGREIGRAAPFPPPRWRPGARAASSCGRGPCSSSPAESRRERGSLPLDQPRSAA